MSELTKAYIELELALLEVAPEDKKEIIYRNIGEALVIASQENE